MNNRIFVRVAALAAGLALLGLPTGAAELHWSGYGNAHWMDTGSQADEWEPPERRGARRRSSALPTIEQKKASPIPAANLVAGGVFVLVSLAAFVYVLLKLL